MKTVSVVMGTYNGERFLREQLDSIINQTYPIYEIIIQDDCSTDGTVGIVREYATKYPIIKLYINEKNLGCNQNFKTAAKLATGDYVAISDQDDIWLPEKIAKLVETIGNHDICFSHHLLYKGEDDIKESNEHDYHIEKLLFTNTVWGHTMLCQRNFVQNPSNWIDSIWCDWSLAINASLQNGIVKVDEALVLWRRHDMEISTKEFSKVKRKPAYHAYLFGWITYKKLLKKENRRELYIHIYEHTDKEHFPLVHQFCDLLLKDDFVSILRLCRLCQINRHLIYFTEQHGLMGWIRGFFFPFMHAEVSSALYKDFSRI